MITVYNVMLVMLGFILAAMAMLFVMPAYRRRIERFATERLKRALPLTEVEIRADKDRLRAEFATEVHKLEMKLDDAGLSTARQSVEINRREARIHDLALEVAAQKASVEENENARRVLEQAIVDRLPKVEQRLNEARRMLQQRDDEIAALAKTSGKQTEALEQATQINVQLRGEAERLRSALETRAARNRETIGDPRFDGEVALRTEIEGLRAKTREQAELIERLQGSDSIAPSEKAAGPNKIETLKSALGKAEAELLAVKADRKAPGGDTERIRLLEDDKRAQRAEIAKLAAALKAREDASAVEGDDNDLINARAAVAALQAEVVEQQRAVDRLKAETAASNEQLVRQAQHFRDEIRRLSARAQGDDGDERRTRSIAAARRSLAARIAEPRVPHTELPSDQVDASSDSSKDAPRPYLKAVNSGTPQAPEAIDPGSERDAANAADSAAKPRRTRLLDRISNIDKSG